ncbi:hypothetical protein FOZ61_008328 [Perkinsus olseni]|uniref:Uncharacterized protein n=1 Tax=Perkinsus olseni TaxID=32597 RepID=A0A7J6LC00_PEROL|nr:hypothetical protein FOZ61_008328 [Perkinsus olseni]KAF4656729.1 hypothetical protein FOL46_007715 [Perkinsus olseni]
MMLLTVLTLSFLSLIAGGSAAKKRRKKQGGSFTTRYGLLGNFVARLPFWLLDAFISITTLVHSSLLAVTWLIVVTESSRSVRSPFMLRSKSAFLAIATLSFSTLGLAHWHTAGKIHNASMTVGKFREAAASLSEEIRSLRDTALSLGEELRKSSEEQAEVRRAFSGFRPNAAEVDSIRITNELATLEDASKYNFDQLTRSASTVEEEIRSRVDMILSQKIDYEMLASFRSSVRSQVAGMEQRLRDKITNLEMVEASRHAAEDTKEIEMLKRRANEQEIQLRAIEGEKQRQELETKHAVERQIFQPGF